MRPVERFDKVINSLGTMIDKESMNDEIRNLLQEAWDAMVKARGLHMQAVKRATKRI